MKNTCIKIFLFIFCVCTLLVCYLIYQRVSAYDNYTVKLNGIYAYQEKYSVVQGDSIKLCLHANEAGVAELYQLSEVLKKTGKKKPFSTRIQNEVYSPKFGFMWEENFSLSTKDLSPGYYVLIFKSQQYEYYQPILIRSKNISSITIVSSTNTWEAYNSFGGKSNYVDNQTPFFNKCLYHIFPSLKPETYIPHNRPYSFINQNMKGVLSPNNHANDFKSGLYSKEYLKDGENHLLKYDTIPSSKQFLRAEWNLPAFLDQNKIGYNVISDYEFAHDYKALKSELIIFQTHSEYWSDEMMGRLEVYLNNGGKVLFASGNNLYRKIEFTELAYTVKNELNDEKQVRNTSGTYYNPITYPKKASYRVEDATHWLFNGSNVKNGDTFTKGGSGWETDKIGVGSGNIKILASGTNHSGPAYLIYKQYPNDAWLINASSMTFCEEIQSDKVLQTIILNAIKNAQKRRKVNL